MIKLAYQKLMGAHRNPFHRPSKIEKIRLAEVLWNIPVNIDAMTVVSNTCELYKNKLNMEYAEKQEEKLAKNGNMKAADAR